MGRDKTERISVYQYRAELGIQTSQAKRPHKYGAEPVIQDGIRFDSKIEYRRYQTLKLLEAAGQITGLQHHPRYILTESCEVEGRRQRPVVYEADFEYVCDGQLVTEDVKGMITSAARIKLKQFAAKYDRQVRIVTNATDPIG